MMTREHPNISLIKKLDLRNLDAASHLFAQNFVWHYFNPKLPAVEGDYLGLQGLQTFFQKIGALTEGTFKVEPISVTPAGDELVVVQVRDTLILEGKSLSLDVVVVWRIVEGLLAEAWDIPSAYTLAAT